MEPAQQQPTAPPAVPTAESFLSTLTKKQITPLELEVAKIFHDIVESTTSQEVRAAVAQLKINKVKEVTVESTGKRALIIMVPYTAFKLHVKPNHQRLINEIEKKSKCHVVTIARRSVMRKNTKRPGLRMRPRSRTLKAVQDAILEDLVGPTEIVGRRLRIKVDGTKVHKILLDPRDKAKENLEEKLSTFTAAYHALTCKDAIFDFPEYTL